MQPKTKVSHVFAREIAAVVAKLLPVDTPRPVVEVLKSTVAEAFRTGETAVARVSPAVSQLFPTTTKSNADKSHLLAYGGSSTGQVGYTIRPVPESVPAHVADPDDWMETLAIWELVGLLEGFPSAPIETSHEAENYVQ